MVRADFPQITIGETGKIYFNKHCWDYFPGRAIQVQRSTRVVVFCPTDEIAPEKWCLPLYRQSNAIYLRAANVAALLGMKIGEKYRLYPSGKIPGGWYIKRGQPEEV